MKDGVRILNVARGAADRRRGPAGRAGLRQGRRRGARRVPQRADHRAPALRLSERHRHAAPRRLDRRGAPTAPATRPPSRSSPRSPAAVVTTAVNVPAIAAEDMEVLGPFLPLCRRLGRLAVGARPRAARSTASRSSSSGRIADRDTRPLTIAVLLGVLAGPHRGGGQRRQRAGARRGARHRGRRDDAHAAPRDFTDLVRVTVVAGGRASRVVGTTLGRRNRPHLLEVWGQRFNLQLEDHMALFRYDDQPGMIGRVGTTFGEHGVNIDSAAVGLRARRGPARRAARPSWSSRRTTRIPDVVVARSPRTGGFSAGRPSPEPRRARPCGRPRLRSPGARHRVARHGSRLPSSAGPDPRRRARRVRAGRQGTEGERHRLRRRGS